ncbi:MAG: hypothetical protein IJ519_02210 [Clostridia bacterium]|nr:hypothetical protein [Clostridia bacterium]
MNRLIKWLDNYWYHYKWHTLIVSFFLVVGVICTVQMLNKEEYDVYALYSGGKYFTVDEQKAVEEAFSYVIEDYDGNGEKNACLTRIVVLSAEELKQKQEEANAENENLAYNFESRTDAIEQLSMELMTGQSYVCFFSEGMYDQVKDKDRFVTLDSIFDTVPEGAVDECAVRLSETNFGSYFSEALSVMGEDTVVCLRKISVQDAGSDKKTEEYENHTEFFKKIIEFKVK